MIAGRALTGLVVVGMTIWGALALHYCLPAKVPLGVLLVGAFSVCGLVALCFVASGRRPAAALLGFAALFAVLLGWWRGIEPSNERDWQPEVAHPEFYNTLIDNCTTGIWMNARINPGHVPLSWKIVASGYLPEYLHEAGMLAAGVSFAELQRLGHVNARAQAADRAPDFSRRIRVGLPGVAAEASAGAASSAGGAAGGND